MAELETRTITSDAHIYDTETDAIQSDSHIYDTETVTITSDAHIVLNAIPKKIQPTMKNAETPPQTGGQGDGEFRVL